MATREMVPAPRTPGLALPGVRWWRLGPGLAMALVAAVILLGWGTDAAALARYLATFVVLVVGPGVLIVRALDRPARLLASELALGTAAGLLLQLPLWALAVATGADGPLLWAGSGAVYLAFALVPGLRRHLRPERYERVLHPLAGWFLAACFAAIALWYTRLFTSELPPSANRWYQDEYWHLALTAELTRQVIPDTPQVAGLPFVYHWLPNVHFAAMGLAADVDLPTVLVRLWVLPIVAVLLGLLVAASDQLTGHGEAAVVVAALFTFRGSIQTALWYGLPGDAPMAIHSPSQTYSVVFLLVGIIHALRALDGDPLGRAWILVVATAVVQPGMKSSNLPILICGMALAVAVVLVVRRPWKTSALYLALLVGALATAGRVLGGGAGGVHYQIGSTIRRLSLWGRFTGLTPAEVDFPSGILLPGLDAPSAGRLLVVILAASLVKYAFALPALPLLARLRPEAWFLLGLAAAGWAAMMLIDHDGQSQVYFMSSAVVALHLLAAWGDLRGWAAPAASGRRPAPWLVGALGGALGILAALAVSSVWSPQPPPDRLLRAMAVPLVTFAATAVMGVAVTWVLTRRGTEPTASGIGLGLATAVVAAALVAGVPGTIKPAYPATLPADAVTVAETEAALWVRDHTDRHALMATNVHCMAVRQEPMCDARAFWVGALTQRQQLVESWAYTDAAHEAHGVNGLRYSRQPFFDHALFALNEDAFAAPTASGLAELRGRGVRWLFADTHRAQVSTTLDDLARVAYRTADVTVYELR